MNAAQTKGDNMDETTTDWMSFRRKHYPRLRRHSPVGITHNGSILRVYECICGASISMDNRWNVTQRVVAFICDHDSCRVLPS